jgi:hypothetical protein
MEMKLKYLFTLLFITFFGLLGNMQFKLVAGETDSVRTSISNNYNNKVEMDDALVANGKIYIVVGVLSVILTGLFIFLISIDYRLRKLEKRNKS